MPLYAPEIHGTDAAGSRVEEYCIHCYRGGGFTQAVTMDEMIRLCAAYAGGENRLHIARMKAFYPRLKRWAKKEDTEHEYYRSINRVIDHVKDRLHEPTDLRTLAGIARISPYHFHRIFKQVVGESLADYVGRLRMEFVAGRLQDSALSLAELAERTGYSSEQALSRAFKAYFGLPPKTFRRLYFRDTFRDELVPRVCKIAARTVISLRDGDSGGWHKLYMYALVRGLMSEATESIEVIRDNEPAPALTVADPPASDSRIEVTTLPEGLYAIFTHRGEADGMEELRAAAGNWWLPRGKYTLAGSPAYIVYLNHEATTPMTELLSEFYLPIVEK